MHIRAVTGDEIKHPRTKVTGAEEVDIALFRRHHFVEIFNVHPKSSSDQLDDSSLALAYSASVAKSRLDSQRGLQ
jgi:hypothetical protein